MRLTIDEYCKHFKMSKEMLNSKLRAKKLNYIIENGQTYIIVTRSSLDKDKRTELHEEKKSQQVSKPKTTVAAVLALYQKENTYLKEKIMQLEIKIDKLIDDKEQMLRDEMQKIEQVYSTKDEQLKNILELVNAKLMLENNNPTVHDVEPVQAKQTIEKTNEKEEPKLIELRSYLRTLDLKAYQRKRIRKRFSLIHDSDIRIIQQNGKLYLDFAKYDYSDLLDY